MLCVQCGHKLEPDKKFCTKCGAPAAVKSPSRSAEGNQNAQLEQNKIQRRWGLILVAGGKGLAKSLLLSALVMGPGLLIMKQQQLLGWLWMLLGSFAMMAWSYRNEWRINWVSCLIPPLAAAASYIVQLVRFGENPNITWLGLAVIVGLAVGIARGGTHKVYIQGGGIYAQRLTGYLLVWLVCYLITQFLSILGRQEALQIGRISGAFSTAMLTVVAIILLNKFRKQKKSLLAARVVASSTGCLALLVLIATFGGGNFVESYVLMQVPDGLQFDTPIPPSVMNDGTRIKPVISRVSGCSVWVSIYRPNPNSNSLQQPVSEVRTSIKNYCSEHPNDPMLCRDCRPTRSIAVAPLPEMRENTAATAAAVIASILILIAAIVINVANAIAEAIRQATEAATKAEPRPGDPGVKTDSNIPPSNRQPDIINPYDDTPFETDDNGNYWAPDERGKWRWMNASQALEAAAALQAEVSGRNKERRDFQKESRRVSDEWMRKEAEEGRQAEDALRRKNAEEELQVSAEERTRQRMINNIINMSNREGGDFKGEVDQLIADGNWAGLGDLYRDKLKDQITGGTQESQTEQTWATVYGVGEQTAEFVKTASKVGLAASGAGLIATGSATLAGGMAAAGTLTGLVDGYGEAAEGHVRGDSRSDRIRKTGSALLTGTKDGAVNVYTATAGALTKIFVQAVDDQATTFIQTGDSEKAKTSGDITTAAATAGVLADQIAKGGGLGRKILGGILGLATSTAEATAKGVHVHGKSWKESLATGIRDSLAGQAGGGLAGRVGSRASDAPPTGGQVGYEQPSDKTKIGKTEMIAGEGSDITKTSRSGGTLAPPPTQAQPETTNKKTPSISRTAPKAPTAPRDAQQGRANSSGDELGAAPKKPSETDPVIRKVREWTKQGKDLPEARADDGDPDAPPASDPDSRQITSKKDTVVTPDRGDGAHLGDPKSGVPEGTDPNSGERNVNPNEIRTAPKPVPEPKPKEPDLTRGLPDPPILDPDTEGYIPKQDLPELHPPLTQEDSPGRISPSDEQSHADTGEVPPPREGVPDGVDPNSGSRVVDPNKIRTEPDLTRAQPDPPILDPDTKPLDDGADGKPGDNAKRDDPGGTESKDLLEGFDMPKQEIPETDPLVENIWGMEPDKTPDSNGRRNEGKSIDEILRNAEDQGATTELTQVDPLDPTTQSQFEEGNQIIQGGSASAEENRRAEVFLDGKTGRRITGAPNAEDTLLGTNKSAIRIDPDTGDVSVVHGSRVPEAHREGIGNRLLAEHRNRIQQTLAEEREIAEQIAERRENEQARAAEEQVKTTKKSDNDDQE